MRLRGIREGISEVFTSFFSHRPFMLAASLSYYTLLSLTPLMLVVIAVGSALYGQTAARGQLQSQIESHVGHSAALMLQTVLVHAHARGQGLSLFIGLAVAALGGTTVFIQLQSSLNILWGVKLADQGWWAWGKFMLRDRLLSLVMVMVIGLLFLSLLVINVVLTMARHDMPANIAHLWWLWRTINVVISLALVTVMVAAIFKTLPDVRIRWRQLWLGSAVTAALFTLGKWLIAFYLAKAGESSSYGAAGAAVALLVWIYYCALIFFLGAEITQVVARRMGEKIKPAAHAKYVTAE